MFYKSAPPIPAGHDQKRAEHQRLRWALLYGMAEREISERVLLHMGPNKQEVLGPPDLTSNPYLTIWSKIAALYSREPIVMPPTGSEDIVQLVADTGFWQLMQRVQRDTLAMREMPVRIDWNEEFGLNIRPIPPQFVQAHINPRRPSKPDAITEWSLDPDDDTKWVQLVYDPRTPAYSALDSDGHDVSERVLGGTFVGEDYPWQTPEGPILPWVIYRAAETGWCWDPYTGREIVEGTLNLAVLMTWYGHLVKTSSWSQKFAVGVEPVGMITEEGGERQHIVTDPSTLLMLRAQDDHVGQPQVGQWQPSADPEKTLGSIMTYEGRLMDMALGSANVSRNSSDIRSGYSLAVSREAQRELQRSYEPVFRRADLELMGKVSGLMGGPSKGWRIEYRSLPQDPTEQKAELDRIAQQVEMGLLDKITAYQQMHVGVSEADAAKAVAEIARLNKSLS